MASISAAGALAAVALIGVACAVAGGDVAATSSAPWRRAWRKRCGMAKWHRHEKAAASAINGAAKNNALWLSRISSSGASRGVSRQRHAWRVR